MASEFSKLLSVLRKEQNLSQRKVAGDLGVSQALLSHYENGIREPGLAFVAKACDYYHVSADYLLGRTLSRDGTTITAEELHDSSTDKNVLKGSIMAMLQKKLIINTTGLLFDLLGKMGSKDAILAASAYLSGTLYKCYRHLYRAAAVPEEYAAIDGTAFDAGVVDADIHYSEMKYAMALKGYADAKGPFPDLSHEALTNQNASAHQSALQLFHTTVDRANDAITAEDK